MRERLHEPVSKRACDSSIHCHRIAHIIESCRVPSVTGAQRLSPPWATRAVLAIDLEDLEG